MVQEEITLKEKRIRSMALSYYSRKDICENMLNFSKNREISPRYFEGFGKRPDMIQFESDIFELAKKGATSFHCSEELWKDPMALSTGLTQEQLNELRQGWDLLIDIDCKWFDYSKKAAEAIIQTLDYNGVKNIGIKFSGSKGFHIIIPWNSFPKKIQDKETYKMFPEWPRAVVGYLKDLSRPILKDLIKETESDFNNLAGFVGVKCNNCNNLAQKGFKISMECSKCNYKESFISFSEEKIMRKCPSCNIPLVELERDREEIYKCGLCSLDSFKNPSNFNKEITETDIFKILGLDLVLVSSRHLFRMPYSLHEKTSLASIVLDKNKLNEFNIKDASPFKIKNPRNFIPESQEGEATELLLQALDYQPKEQFGLSKSSQKKKPAGKFREIIIKDLTPELYPPSIKSILSGIKSDGRKRALFILLNFFKSLKVEQEKIEKIIEEWNTKNYQPLHQNYIRAQLLWHLRALAKLPPNFDKPHYKEIGIIPTPEELNAKNPVNYVIRKSFALQNTAKNKSQKK